MQDRRPRLSRTDGGGCPTSNQYLLTTEVTHGSLLQLAFAEEHLVIAEAGLPGHEIEREVASYTIDTLRSLQKEGDFRLILYDEAIGGFDQWKEAQELVRLAPPLIGTRKEPLSSGQGPVGDALRRGYTQTRIFEISSTEVRERIQKKLYCGHLVPDKVLDYIGSHHLYSLTK